MKTCIMDKKTILYTKSNSTGLNNQQKTSRTFQLSISEVVLLQHLPIQHAKSSNKTVFLSQLCLSDVPVALRMGMHDVQTIPKWFCLFLSWLTTTSLPHPFLDVSIPVCVTQHLYHDEPFGRGEQWSKTLNLSNSYTCNSQQKVKPLLSSYYHLFQPLLTCLIGT